MYCYEGSIFVAGSAIQWLRDKLKFFKNSKHKTDIFLGLTNKKIYIVKKQNEYNFNLSTFKTEPSPSRFKLRIWGCCAAPASSFGENLLDVEVGGAFSEMDCIIFVEFDGETEVEEEAEGKMFDNQLLALFTPPSDEPTIAPGF